jgi:hypothetical protein
VRVCVCVCARACVCVCVCVCVRVIRCPRTPLCKLIVNKKDGIQRVLSSV